VIISVEHDRRGGGDACLVGQVLELVFRRHIASDLIRELCLPVPADGTGDMSLLA
jgi:hypothetical protein